jgi:endo-1,4-beta-xylanase
MRTALVLTLASAALLAPVAAAQQEATMEHPLSLIANSDLTAPLAGTWQVDGGDRIVAEVIPAEVGGYTNAVRCTLDPAQGAPPWSLAFGQRTTGPIQQGDVVYFRAWLRSPDKCPVTFVLEQASGDFRKFISQAAVSGPEWAEYRFAAEVPVAYAAAEAQAKLFLGDAKGTIEIAGIRVESYGKADLASFDQTIDYWAGRPHSDEWRAAALQRIEEIRKGDLRVTVLGNDGAPLPGAKVHVTMRRHGFRFGSAVPAGRLVDRADLNNVRFQEEVARLYNTVTFENDLKWGSIGDGKLSTVNQAVEWCKARGIDVRGHCLVWGSYEHLPVATRSLRDGALWQACADHVTDYASRMRGKVYLWDVVNEAGNNTEIWDEVGWDRFPEAFRLARAADPDARLCYNDFGIVHDNSPGQRESAAKRIEQLLAADAPFTTLGLQAHCGLPLTPMDRVLATLDRWAAFGKDLEITEFDLCCPDDAVHAEWSRDFLIACFSHPAIKSFIQWGFWQGSHWLGDKGAAMFRMDWSKRPAQEAYEDLVLRQWWTDWRGETNAEGMATLRAFYGTHTIQVATPDAVREVTVELVPGGNDEVRIEL